MKTTLIDNLVGVLSVRNKKALEDLQEIMPDARVVLGDDGKDPVGSLASLSSDQASALFKFSRQALMELQPFMDPAVEKLRSKLKLVGVCSLIGQIVAVLGSSGAGVMLLKANGMAVQITAALTAFVAFFGSVVSLAMQYMRSDLTGTENGASKQYSELRDLRWRTRVVMAQLEVMKVDASGKITATDVNVIAEANSLAGAAHRLLTDLGFPLTSVK